MCFQCGKQVKANNSKVCDSCKKVLCLEHFDTPEQDICKECVQRSIEMAKASNENNRSHNH